VLKKVSQVDWKNSLLLFGFIAVFHFAAAFSKFIGFNFIGFALYALIPLLLIRRPQWFTIRIQKPKRYAPIFLAIISVGFVIGISYLFLQTTVGTSTSNFIVLLANNQIKISNINPNIIWASFPLAVISLCLVSPITEELFYRGLLLKSLEVRFSSIVSNIIQGVLFGVIHLAYCWYVAFDVRLIYTMIPWISLTGIIYGWVTQKTDSLFSAVLVHIIGNLGLAILMFSLVIPALFRG